MKAEELNKIAKRYAQDELKDNHSAVEDVVAAAFLNGIDYAEHHPHWISVEDEMPEAVINDNVTKMVLTYSTDGYIRLDRYMRYYHKWVNGASEVTHWMPLPEPPKKGGKQ